MSAIGVMAMPVNFRYREVFLRGKPRHDRCDPFRIRHPSMDRRKRAKIFAPFDALRGFSEAVASKDVLYEDRAWSLRVRLHTGICFSGADCCSKIQSGSF